MVRRRQQWEFYGFPHVWGSPLWTNTEQGLPQGRAIGFIQCKALSHNSKER